MTTKMQKVNFTLPEDVAEALKTQVGKRKRSAFVALTLKEKLRDLERERLREELIEGYKATAEEGAEINKEWEAITLEGWPD